jgi:hypothetical protein
MIMLGIEGIAAGREPARLAPSPTPPSDIATCPPRHTVGMGFCVLIADGRHFTDHPALRAVLDIGVECDKGKRAGSIGTKTQRVIDRFKSPSAIVA